MSNSWVCVDANIVVHLLRDVPDESAIVALWQKWRKVGQALVAPTLLCYEVSNALHRYVVHEEMLPDEAAATLDIALGLDIVFYGDADLHRRSLALAKRFSLPAVYDAHYLALAERLGAEFWTADKRLLQAVRELSWVHGVQG